MINVDDLLNSMETEVVAQNNATNSSMDPRFLRLKKGVKYRGRFVPKQHGFMPAYEEVGFTSRTTGNYINLGRAWSDPAVKNTGPDIVNSTQWAAYKEAKERGDDAAMKETYKLIPQRKTLVNFYLVDVEGDDPEGKDKIGKVVVAKCPAGLDKEKKPRSTVYKNIQEGLFNEEYKKKIGKKGFLFPDTIEDGVDFVFDVVDKGGFPNYDNSKFDLIKDSKVNLTKNEVLNIIQNTHDLMEMLPPLKSQEELKQLLDQHWFGTSASPDDDVNSSSSSTLKSLTDGLLDDDDDIPMTHASDKTLDEELDEILK